MKLNKWMLTSGIAGAFAIFSMAACGVNQGNEPGSASASTDPVSHVTTALTGGVFDGNSVRITAHRNGTPDNKYAACVTDATGCFNFATGSNGVPTPVPGDTGAESFDNLCPCGDVNASDAGGNGEWTFTYEVYSQENCTGTELTGEGNNFTCYAESDLAAKQFPNETANECLAPGPVVNTIICLSETTQKSFDFNVCQELPGAPAECTLLDCACAPSDTGACECSFNAKQGLPPGNLPPGCTFDAQCNLVCCPPVPTCPCADAFPLWNTALANTPVSCASNANANQAIWEEAPVQFGLIASGTTNPGEPGYICGVQSFVSGEENVLTITAAESAVCINQLEVWEAAHGLTCNPLL